MNRGKSSLTLFERFESGRVTACDTGDFGDRYGDFGGIDCCCFFSLSLVSFAEHYYWHSTNGYEHIVVEKFLVKNGHGGQWWF